MGVHVLPEELAKEWSLSFADIEFVNAKPAASRLGLAVQLKFFAAFGYFATAATEVPDEAVSYLAEQLGVSKADLCQYDFSGRSGRRHCAEILRHLGFRRMKRADRAALADWIATELCPGRAVGRGDAGGCFSLVPGSQDFRSVGQGDGAAGALRAATFPGILSWQCCGSASLRKRSR